MLLVGDQGVHGHGKFASRPGQNGVAIGVAIGFAFGTRSPYAMDNNDSHNSYIIRSNKI